MKRTLRLFSLTVILLIVIQIITLHYFGKSALIRKIQEDNSELLTGTDRGIAITYCNCNNHVDYSLVPESYHIFNYENIPPLTDKEQEVIQNLLSRKFTTVRYVRSEKELNEYQLEKGYIRYNFCVDTNFFSVTWVEESVSLKGKEVYDTFVQTKYSLYIWLFFKWHKLEDLGGGIS